MALSICEPCCQPRAWVGDQLAFREAELRVLCGILEVLTSGGGVGANVNIQAFGGTPVTIGQHLMAASMPVVIASNQSDVPINLAQVGGAAVAQGHGTAAAAIRVELPTDGTGVIASVGSITTSVTPGTAAGNLGKAEDAATASGDTGVAVLLKRSDTAAVQTDTNGDYTLPVANSFGAQQINIDSAFQASSNTGILKAKAGTASTAGEVGVQALFYTNTDLAAGIVASNNQYCPAAVAVNGAVYVLPFAGSSANTPLRFEDAAFAAGSAVCVAGVQRQDTPTNDTSTDGDLAPAKANTVGALYHESANQAGAYGATTTAGTSGAIPTTGANVHTNSSKAKIVSVRNKLDVDVLISLDAGTTYPFYVAVNENFITDLGTNGRWTASNIFAKAIGSNSASGNIYVGTVI